MRTDEQSDPVMDFIVRSEGHWVATGGAPRVLTFDQVLERLAIEKDTVAMMPDVGGDAQPPSGSLVRGVGPWAGGVRVGCGLEVGRADDTAVILGPSHLRVIDACADSETWVPVEADPGVLEDLVAARVVERSAVEHSTDDLDAGDQAPAPAEVTDGAPRRIGAVLSRISGVLRPSVPAAGFELPKPVLAPVPVAPTLEAVPGGPTPELIGPRGGPAPGGPDGRIVVYSPWHADQGPPLASGMLTAAARAFDGGILSDTFEIRRPEAAASVLADIESREGLAIVLCSNYVWSLNDNLAFLDVLVDRHPNLLAIHGGPSTPKYEGDAEGFLEAHANVTQVLARGEGEALICDLLTALAASEGEIEASRLGEIGGLTFIDPETRQVVRTGEPARIDDLDQLPSPYLTGEFDHIPIEAWRSSLAIESNRGCPYGCTYCDWGSVTLSRIRKFDNQRVAAEIDWATERGVVSIQLTDANFGIMSRDVDTARHLAEAKEHSGFPDTVTFCPAKNTTKHLVSIMDVFNAGGVNMATALGVQSTDPVTLQEVDRSNISVDSYVRLAAEIRRRGHSLQGELLMGLPGQTYDSYRLDLQFMFDHEVLMRTWPVQVLPNAPMNDPEYRARNQIEVDEDNLVISTSSFTRADRERMLRLRRIAMILDMYGVARHVLRWAQWDHGVVATEVMDRMLVILDDDPERFPYLSWTLRYFEHHPVAPVAWSRFYGDLRRLLLEDFQVPESSAKDAVLAINHFLMPDRGRTFPATTHLSHDYLAYYRDGIRGLLGDGQATMPTQPLASYGPAAFTVKSDPLELCTTGLHFEGPPGTNVVQSDFYMATASAYELLSGLTRPLLHVLRMLDADDQAVVIDAFHGGRSEGELAELGRAAEEAASHRADSRVAVGVTRRRPTSDDDSAAEREDRSA